MFRARVRKKHCSTRSETSISPRVEFSFARVSINIATRRWFGALARPLGRVHQVAFGALPDGRANAPVETPANLRNIAPLLVSDLGLEGLCVAAKLPVFLGREIPV